ncbi:MAG: alpha-amylase family glycosyl hydrolase [Candidatus Pseudoruminococcus sp.]|uniref:starch-binding protein n=1 Tax=Candidatus Pseudoruminococcus sp. TaxID=3101048 RepID=UPI002A76FAAD|nr:alpha-amylase family glycosyl hydrolase [Ruminococcus sp.]MDY2782448.1 alpha-amylase family glycosyl hydrolase [Candidatus Pseudoruminococcus sp.]
MKVIKKSGFAKKAAAFTLSAAMITSAFSGLSAINSEQSKVEAAAIVDNGLRQSSQEGVILHCWNWSYSNIKKYMKDIAASGYTSIQTSPVTQPKDYYWEGIAYGNVGIPDGTGDSDHGNWWKVYQPVTMSICDNGHTWFGTKAEFKAMCDEAEKYGVRVIVDIVANHMGNIKGWKIGSVEEVMGDISPQVGEFWNPDMLTDSSYWHISTSWVHSSDGRFDVTQGNMGMPDLNTGDSKVQQMVLNLLKECIDCGADGFRFDAAKHIETPADDPAFASNFWDVVLDGARDYYKQVNHYDGVYFYGEVLNRIDDTNAEAYYRSKMSITDNSTSDNIRNSVKYKSASGAAQGGYCGYIAGEGDKCVLWAESHDTYMGGGSSYDCTDSDIKKTWAMVASKKDSTALFFARPFYSKYILKDDTTSARQTDDEILAQTDYTQMGDVGTLTWADKEVVEVNRFHNFFVGQSEQLGSSGECAYNVRGNSGVVISKMDGAGDVSFSVDMKDGTYTDQVSGNKFTVSGGEISGTVGSKDGIAVVYNPTKQYADPSPVEPTIIKISANVQDGSTTFTTDSVDVIMKAENATSATYETSEGDKGSFTGSKTITVGSSIASGETVTIAIKATADDGTSKEKTFIFKKKAPRTGYPKLSKAGIVFDNASYGWSNVYAYVYSAKDGNNGAWPGAAMTEVDGDYWTYELPDKFSGTVNIIFSNGSGTQLPGANQPGLEMAATEKKLFIDGNLIDLPETPAGELKVSLSSSASSIDLGNEIKLTANSTGGNGSVTYQFSVGNEVIQAYGSSKICTWKPSKAGVYTIKVTAKDSAGNTASDDKTIAVTEVTQELKNNSTISAASINLGSSIKMTANATGGTAPYSYKYFVKSQGSNSWTALTGITTAASCTNKPTKAGTYQYAVRVIDSTGKYITKYFTVKVNGVAALANNSTISATSINLGSSIKMTAKATGGTAPYNYKYFVKSQSSTSWTALTGITTATTCTNKPSKAGTYQYAVRVIDSKNQYITKTFTVKVNDVSVLANNSTISATSINLGSSIKITAKATGGTAPYSYKYFVRPQGDIDWTALTGVTTATTCTNKPSKAGTYQYAVRVIDSKGKYITKTFTVKVNGVAALANASTISATSINLGSSVKMTAKATGGTAPYKYSYFCKPDGAIDWVTLKNATTVTSYTNKPTKTGDYQYAVRVIDSTGKYVTKYFTVTVK